MEISAERKKQIEEEERQRIAQDRQRIAEERYRAEVRAALTSAKGRQTALRDALVVLAIGVVGTILIFHFLPLIGRVKPQVARLVHIPMIETIASARFPLGAGGYRYFKFVIEPDMLLAEPATVKGWFTASGGSGNDVAVFIADEIDYTNWTNGHAARAQYKTGDPKTAGEFDVRLDKPGTYFLCFSNWFSAISEKSVRVEAALTYNRPDPLSRVLQPK